MQGFYPGDTTQKLRAITAYVQGTDDPTVVPTVGAIGTLYCQLGTTNVFQKTDAGRTTNWVPFGGAAAVPGAPVNSVQFNNAGAFGGDAEFTYIPATDYLQLGAGTPLAAGARVFVIGLANTAVQGTDSLFIGSSINTSGFNFNESLVLGTGLTALATLTRGIVVGVNHIVAAVSNSSVVTGNAHQVRSTNSFIGGDSNNITSDSSLVVGISNGFIGAATASMIAGQLNLAPTPLLNCIVAGTNNTARGNNTLMVGSGNALTTGLACLIAGNTNTVGATATTDNSIVAGVNNTVDGSHSIVAGSGNTVGQVGGNNIVNGDNNNAPSSSFALVVGQNNTIADMASSLVSGTGNAATTISNDSVLSGNGNSVGTATNSFIAGQSNTSATDVTHSILVGNTNVIPSIVSSVVSGANHSVAVSVTGSFMAGSINATAASVTNSIWVGVSNTIDDVIRSCVVGSAHVFGATTGSIIIGDTHTGAALDYLAIFGQGNTATRSHQLLAGNGVVADAQTLFAAGIANFVIRVSDDGLIEQDKGGQRVKTRTDAGALVTVDARTDYFIACTNAAPITANLPAGVNGMTYVINAATASGGVTLVPNGADVIDNGTAIAAGTQSELFFDSGVWYRP